MVFSAALHASTSTGVSHRDRSPEDGKLKEYPGGDLQAPRPEQAFNKHDVAMYTFTNASVVGGAGLVAGLQEAFYAFNKMPDHVARNLLTQAGVLLPIVGKKTLLGFALGAAFCYTEATLENTRGKHDIWNGVAGGAAAGLLFSMLPPKPMPQPLAWPLWFGAIIAGSDFVSELGPACFKDFRQWGPVRGRDNWGDPEPPRPPILDTGTSQRATQGNFWRSGSYSPAASAPASAHH